MYEFIDEAETAVKIQNQVDANTVR